MANKVEWISVKEKLPDCDIDCLVYNTKGYMGVQRAYFYHTDNIFTYYSRSDSASLTLEVSHYFEIPEPPPLENRFARSGRSKEGKNGE